MKKVKAFLSAVLICALLICIFPVTVIAAADGTASTWTDFLEEFDAVKDTGGTITLTADIEKTTDTEEEFSAAAGVTVDTNGYSIIISGGTVTFGANVTIIGSTDYVVPLKAAGAGESSAAEILLNGATVKKNDPALGAAVEIGQYGVLRTANVDTLIQGVNIALDVKDGGKAYHEYGSILAINTGIGAATAICVRAGGELQLISAEVGATSNNSIGILVDGFLRVSGSASVAAGGDGASGILIQSGGEATVENGGIVAHSGESTSGIRVTGGELTLRGGTAYGVTYGILAIPNSQLLITGTAVAGQRGTSVNISETGILIEGANGQNTLLTIEDGTVKGTEIGVKAENHCDVEIRGGSVDASSSSSGCGLLLAQSSAATVDGASVLGGTSESGCGITVLPSTTVTVSQSEGKTTTVTGGKGALVSGTLHINGGTVTGNNTYGVEIGEGGKLTMHGGDVSGTGTGIVTNDIGDTAEIWGGTVFGTEIGINNAGSLSMMGGSVTGGNDNGLSLGSSSQTVLYHGAAASQTEGIKAIFVEGDPELCVYSGFSGGDSIHIEEGHTNYVTRQSLTPSSLPDTVFLTMGENRTITMEPNGQSLDGGQVLLEDIIGAGPVTLQSGSDNIASFTVSGNEFTFTPINPGTAILTIEDTLTYNGIKTISVVVASTTYTVTFNSNGSVYSTKTVNAGESIGSAAWPADPMRDSYTFGGWFTGENGAGSQFTSATPVNATTTVYAKWLYSGSGGGGGGGGSTPSTTAYKADVTAGNGAETTLPVTVNKNSGTAYIDLGSQDLASGGTVITIPSIPDASAYSVGISVPDLSTADSQGTLTVNTEAGNVTIPSNMLTGVSGINGSKAQINIGQGDKSNLPQDVRAAIDDKPLIQLTLSIDGKQADWSNPDAPVTVSIPYAPTAEELANLESIVVWYIDGSGNVITISNGHYVPATGMVTFNTTHFSDYAVAYNPVIFNDVAASTWYHDAVSFIAARGITDGTGNSKYSPDAKLTRGEFLVMMMRAYGIEPDTNSTDNFADAENAYYTGYLAAAKRLGISAGVGNNMFAPGKEITRQEMFKLLYNALKVIGQLPQGNSGKALSDFTDASSVADWAEEAITLLVKTGTIGGSNGALAPLSTTTRAEMAQVLYNLLGK